MPKYDARLEAAHAERNRFIAFVFAVAEMVIEADEAALFFSPPAPPRIYLASRTTTSSVKSIQTD